MAEKILGNPLPELAEICKEAVAQGAVLLKNEGQMLPVTEKDHVALFGRCQIDYYRTGTGSGGSVNVPYTTNLLSGMRRYPQIRLNESIAKTYENWVAEHPFDKGNGQWASEPHSQQEMPLTEELVKEAASVSNKAIIVIGRTAGEEQDNAMVEGSYLLSAGERDMIDLVTKYFTQTAVVFNVSNIIDMKWVSEDFTHGHIKSLLYTWQGGIEGGNAAADLLVGESTPSGRLSDTIAANIEDYPSHSNYGSETCNLYSEDIYVGYRYFETFDKEKVLYPFGFGLSYTTFTQKVTSVAVRGNGKDLVLTIGVKVTNTGDYMGREVVQLYAEAPQGKLGKPARVLVDFEKTQLLAPGESCEVEMVTEAHRFASYDDSGVTGHKSCYVLEAGEYHFYVAANVRDAVGKATISLAETVVVEELTENCSPRKPFKRMKAVADAAGNLKPVLEDAPLKTYDIKERILKHIPAELPKSSRTDITFNEVLAGKADLEAFVAQLSVRELATLVRGEGMMNPRVTAGTAAAFGGVSDELAKRGIPAGCASDGPSGIRMDGGGQATQLPIGTLLACSFNTELVEELFYLEGKEMYLDEVDTLLGPGMNIHRHPLNGRNFEYFSEDPYLTGKMAAACESGMHRAGVMGTIKHFCCNNQEKERHNVESVVSERALREIYLKGFEMAVKEGGATSVMTTYNPLNGYQNACNYDLTTTILRGEWGFDGIVMTDWWAKLDDVIEGYNPNYTDAASMVRAQNDIYMVVNNDGAAINAKGDNIEEALANGSLTLGELQRCAMNILKFLLDMPCAKRPVVVPEPAAFTALSREASDVSAKVPGDVAVTATMEQDGITVQVQEDGIYGINVKIMSKAPDLAQMLSQLFINDEKAADIPCRGTRGMWIRKRVAQVKLQKGVYKMQISHIRPGIELESITFEKEA